MLRKRRKHAEGERELRDWDSTWGWVGTAFVCLGVMDFSRHERSIRLLLFFIPIDAWKERKKRLHQIPVKYSQGASRESELTKLILWRWAQENKIASLAWNFSAIKGKKTAISKHLDNVIQKVHWYWTLAQLVETGECCACVQERWWRGDASLFHSMTSQIKLLILKQ